MPYYYIVDIHAEERKHRFIRKMQVCDMLSKMYLEFGHFGFQAKHYSEIKAKQFWIFDGIVPTHREVSQFGTKNIKWYIKNQIPFSHKIWNGSYFHGLSQFGKIKEPTNKQGGGFYPSMVWWSSKKLMSIVKAAPFGGKIIVDKRSDEIRWSVAPCLLLPFDEKSFSFMAGVLSTGRLVESNGFQYAVYTKSCSKWISKWGIPIEKRWGKGEVLISPFWPAMLESYMPDVAKGWVDLKKPFEAATYSAILWRVYSNFDFQPDLIPYLPGRRCIFYTFGNDKLGATKHLELLRVEKGLTQLDDRFRVLIQQIQPENGKVLRK